FLTRINAALLPQLPEMWLKFAGDKPAAKFLANCGQNPRARARGFIQNSLVDGYVIDLRRLLSSAHHTACQAPAGVGGVMPRWSAAQILSGFALRKPLEREEWSSDMDGKILPAQLKLREAIAQQRISDVRGRLGPPGSKEQRLTDLFSDSESMGFTLLVTSYGTLTVHPPYKRHKFEEKHKINLDDWWGGINFDQDEGEQAVSGSLAPCKEQQSDRPHLRLVSGARSGETETLAARAEESTPKPAPAVEPEP